MFPVLTLIMENVVEVEGMPEQFFTNLFGVMFIGMAPLTSMASIIAEEKEKNTLRALMMSNVKPAEYLIGVGFYNWCICMLVFSFMPMLSMFSKGIEKAARITYSQQIHSMIYQLDSIDSVAEPVAVIAVNMILAVVLFIYAYRRSGLE